MAADLAIEAALGIIQVLRNLKVDYLVGGSLASSIHGTPRSTNDVDSNCTSERQWNDLLGVLKVQQSLDRAYLLQWAAYLDVEDLYLKALQDTDVDPEVR